MTLFQSIGSNQPTWTVYYLQTLHPPPHYHNFHPTTASNSSTSSIPQFTSSCEEHSLWPPSTLTCQLRSHWRGSYVVDIECFYETIPYLLHVIVSLASKPNDTLNLLPFWQTPSSMHDPHLTHIPECQILPTVRSNPSLFPPALSE